MKHVYAIQMSYDITNEEKNMAEKALLSFNMANNSLDSAVEYLNEIYNPFSANQSMDLKKIWDNRADLRDFSEKVIIKFNSFKKISFKCVQLMGSFSFDTQTIKLLKSFTNAIEELEVKVNDFIGLFDDLKNKDFVKKIIESVDSIRKKSEEISSLIDKRIRAHIKNNILSKSWVDNIGDELNSRIEKKTPLLVDIYNEK